MTISVNNLYIHKHEINKVEMPKQGGEESSLKVGHPRKIKTGSGKITHIYNMNVMTLISQIISCIFFKTEL